MHSGRSSFVANIVPLQNVQTNISGQGNQQLLQTNVSALQSLVSSLQTTISALDKAVISLQTSLASIDARVTLLEDTLG